MAITQAMCTSFKVQILQALHNFGPTSANTFKIALYTNAASLDATTSAYTPANEVSSVNYSGGGQNLTISTTPTSGGTTAFLSFSSPVTWSGVSFTARGALIYNDSLPGKNAVAVISFGTDQVVSGGDFNIIFPAASSTTAILRIE